MMESMLFACENLNMYLLSRAIRSSGGPVDVHMFRDVDKNQVVFKVWSGRDHTLLFQKSYSDDELIASDQEMPFREARIALDGMMDAQLRDVPLEDYFYPRYWSELYRLYQSGIITLTEARSLFYGTNGDAT